MQKNWQKINIITELCKYKTIDLFLGFEPLPKQQILKNCINLTLLLIHCLTESCYIMTNTVVKINEYLECKI